MKTEEWIEKATAYFNGSMSTEEAQFFEKETAASEELSKLMQLWKATEEEGIYFEQNRDAAAVLLNTHEKLKRDFTGDDGKVKSIKYSPWRWVAIAAVAAGIIILMKVFVPPSADNSMITEQKEKKDSNQIVKRDSSITPADSQNVKETIQPHTLFAQHFKPDEVPEDPNGPLDDVFFYYASKQYRKAVIAIDSAGNRILTRGTDSFAPLTRFYASYYKALSMMSLGNDTSAIALLEQSVSLAPSAFLRSKAHWYLALAYLKMENISAAKDSLRLLIDNPSAGAYKQKAEKLMAALNK
jgi:tetratricopeptide (TPR) repeat protein